MGVREIFLSYAAGDPDWPAADVAALAREIKVAGAVVHLDQFHRDQVGRKLSPDEWQRWMYRCIERSHHVLCLCSPHYRLATDRDPDISGGFGVAFESFRIVQRLYQSKGHNNGWVWAVHRQAQVLRAVTPRMLDGQCPGYCLETERATLISDVSRAMAGTENESAAASKFVEGSTAEQPAAPEPDGLKLTQQVQHATTTLKGASALWLALSDDDFDGEKPTRLDVSSAASFVSWLANADVSGAKAAMFAVRRALESVDKQASERHQAQDAAVALWLLSACRLVDHTIKREGPGHIVVPDFGSHRARTHLYCAVISTALAGGQLILGPDEHPDLPRPLYSYGLHIPAGDEFDALFERALFNAVFLTPQAVEMALSDTPLDEVDRSKLVARLKTIRRVSRQALTLIVFPDDRRAVATSSRLADEFQVPLFVCDKTISNVLLGMDAHEFVSELGELWQSLESPTNRSMTTVPPTLDLALLLPMLAALQEASRELKDSARQQESEDLTRELLAAVRDNKPESTGRVKTGLESIKNLSDASEGGERLFALAVRAFEFLKPFLS